MKIGRIQNIVIFLLVVLCFLQTGELWFGGTPNRNFFYSFLDSGADDVNAENLSGLSKPYRIVTGKTPESYQIKYSGIEASDQKIVLDDAMSRLFSGGEYVGVSEIDWTVLGKSLLFEYRCDIPADAFTAAYKQKSSLLSARVKSFDKILLTPGGSSFEPAKILFLVSSANECYEYRIAQSDLSTRINAARDSFSVVNDQIYYIASSSLPSALFSSHVFIASWDGGALQYADIEKINPFSDKGDVFIRSVEDKINTFFDNPDRKQYRTVNGVFTFSDERTVVKYHQSNVLECYTYRTADESVTTTFTSAYSQAVEFIKRDTTITDVDEYHLANYETDENGQWTLYFDFTVNDLPVFISNRLNSTPNSPQLNHAIEISVSHDIVVKYMRCAYVYRAREAGTSVATVDGFQALDSAVSNYAVPDEEDNTQEYPDLIRAIDIGYNIDNSDNVSLYWYAGYNQIKAPFAFSAN